MLFAVANLLYYWLSLSLFHPVVGIIYLLFCYYFAIFVIVVNENITVWRCGYTLGTSLVGNFARCFFLRGRGFQKFRLTEATLLCLPYPKKLNKKHYFAVIGLYFSHQRLMVCQRSEVNVDGVLSSLCLQI